MQTAKQVNADQIGHYDFVPGSNEAVIIGGDQRSRQMLKVLFSACGWKVSVKRRKTKRRKKK